MFLKRIPCGFSSKLIDTFVLSQFDRPQIISPRIEISKIFPCLRISFSVYILLSTLIILIVCDYHANFISFPFMTLIILKNNIESVFIIARKAVQYSKCFLSCRTIVIHNLTAKELEYIPKIILLREFKNYINQLWDRLPEHIKADLKVQQHRRCLYFALLSIAY